MKKIPLTQGKFAIVDDADFEWLSQYKWRIQNKRNGNYYARCSMKLSGKWVTQTMHRLIMNAEKGKDVDHINHNGLDNRRQNLRICTRKQNLQNIRKRSKTSKFKGVSWSQSRHRWCASICVNQKRINLGRYKTEDEAAMAYDKAAKMYFGEFANLNFKEAV